MNTTVATQPKEIALAFKPDMFRAVLEDRKYVTRRVVIPSQSAPRIPPQLIEPWIIDGEQETVNDLPAWLGFHPDYPTGQKFFTSPYGKAGDRYYLLEPTQILRLDADSKALVLYPYDEQTHWCNITESDLERIEARKDWTKPAISRFMLKSFARHWCECVSVRPKRLQDITEEDAIAEGAEISPGKGCWTNYSKFRQPGLPINLKASFKTLWDSINSDRGYGWDSNPWVWRVEFRRLP